MISSFVFRISSLFKSKDPDHIRAGLWGEQVAEKFLKDKGYKILGRRVRIGHKDELDLVARHNNVLVFVEVKTRATEEFGRAFSAVNRNKQRNLSRAAVRYLMALKQKPEYHRFDVVEVIGHENENNPVIRHIENAFLLDKKYRLPW